MAAAVLDFSGFPTREWTQEEILAMSEQGILRPEDHVELLEGRLVQMTPQGPPHQSTLGELVSRMAVAYQGKGWVSPQCPLDVDRRSLPEPDLAVVRGRPADYRQRHPRGADTILVVEVARSSQAVDRAKAVLYARAGVPVYWLVDLAARRVESREGPAPDGSWKTTRLLAPGERLALPELRLDWDAAEVLGVEG